MCFDLVGLPGNDPIHVLALAAPHLAVPDPTPETVDNQVRFLACKLKSMYFRCIMHVFLSLLLTNFQKKKLQQKRFATAAGCSCSSCGA